MRRMAIYMVITFAPLPMSARQDVTPASNPLVRLWDASLDMSAHGHNASSCILVRADGHFHMESRWQQIPNPTAAGHIYEGTLNRFQLDRLRNLLDRQSVKDLSPYAPPHLPGGLTLFASFTASVFRGAEVRSVGYFVWGEQHKFEESFPDSAKEQWSAAKTALLPVAQLFQEIQGTKWPELPLSASTLCHIDADPPGTSQVE